MAPPSKVTHCLFTVMRLPGTTARRTNRKSTGSYSHKALRSYKRWHYKNFLRYYSVRTANLRIEVEEMDNRLDPNDDNRYRTSAPVQVSRSCHPKFFWNRTNKLKGKVLFIINPCWFVPVSAAVLFPWSNFFGCYLWMSLNYSSLFCHYAYDKD